MWNASVRMMPWFCFNGAVDGGMNTFTMIEISKVLAFRFTSATNSNLFLVNPISPSTPPLTLSDVMLGRRWQETTRQMLRRQGQA